MRHLIIVAIVLFAAGCGGRAGGDLHQRVLAAGSVRIGVKADAPPFGSERQGVRQGFDIDIAAAVARRLGVEPVFVSVTSADRIPRLCAGEVDMVVASMTQTRGRDRLVDFSIPYFEDGPAILVRTGSGIASYLQVGGRRLGVATGSSTAGTLATVVPEAIVVEVPAIADLLPALDAGRVDAVASDALILAGLVRASGHPADYAMAGGRIISEPYGIAVPQDESAWRDAINEALMAIWEDGEWARIADSWFGPAGALPAPISFQMPTIPR